MPFFPFSALVGQDLLKRALILGVIAPEIGGVLLCGKKGTGKSIAARSFGYLISERPKPCLPFINLPLNSQEENLWGCLDFRSFLEKRKSRFLPGLLEKAKGGILYVDEINLIPSSLEFFLAKVQEEGVFLLASINPEEGGLSPGLRDRFGFCVFIEEERDLELRVEIMKRHLALSSYPKSFAAFRDKDKLLKQRIFQARRLYPKVRLLSKEREYIVRLCIEAQVIGHRAELVIQAAAKARAAYQGALEVRKEDIEAVAPLALLHRCSKSFLSQYDSLKKKEISSIEKKKKEDLSEKKKVFVSKKDTLGLGSSKSFSKEECILAQENQGDSFYERLFPIGKVFPVDFVFFKRLFQSSWVGRRVKGLGRRGLYVKAVWPREAWSSKDLALEATIRAAIPFQFLRGWKPGKPLFLTPEDIRIKQRSSRVGTLLFFVVDASGSMGAQERMKETKATIMSLLASAYHRRDKIAFMLFRKDKARLLLPPTNSIDLAAKILENIHVGGSTPLSAALWAVGRFLERVLIKEPFCQVTVFLLTDGRGNVSLSSRPPQEEIRLLARALAQRFSSVHFVVIDTEIGPWSLKMAQTLAQDLRGEYFTPESLKAQRLVKIAQRFKEKGLL